MASENQNQSTAGCGGCLGCIGTLLVIFVLLFGFTWSGVHYEIGCSSERGMEFTPDPVQDEPNE